MPHTAQLALMPFNTPPSTPPYPGICLVLHTHTHTQGGLHTPESQQDVDVSRHFSYYAFEGGHGESIWKHASGAFHKDLEASADELRPQEDYRCVVVGCGVFRGCVLIVMCHCGCYVFGGGVKNRRARREGTQRL